MTETSVSSTGYSGKSLEKKLGVKAGMRAVALRAPRSYFENVTAVGFAKRLGSGEYDFIHAFFESVARLSQDFPRLLDHLSKSGMLWISWPKKAAKLATDLDENVLRQIGLDAGLVDVKVCAVDEVWSALKFVYRKSDR